MIETKDLLRKIKLARKYIQDQEYQEAYNTLYLPPEYESNLVEAQVSPTKPTPICNNCKHFVKYDLIKDLQSACINKESEAKWISNPEVFGCTLFEKE